MWSRAVLRSMPARCCSSLLLGHAVGHAPAPCGLTVDPMGLLGSSLAGIQVCMALAGAAAPEGGCGGIS